MKTLILLLLVSFGVTPARATDDFPIVGAKVVNTLRVRTLFVTGEDILGEMRGGHTQKTFFSHLDDVYVFLNAKDIPSGTRFSIISYETEEDKEQGARYEKRKYGRLAHIVGEVEIITNCQQLSKAWIRSNYGPIRRGDKLISWVRPIDKNVFPDPPPKVSIKVLRGEVEDQHAFRTGEYLILDHGQDVELLVGNQFRVYRDKDPVSKSIEDVEPTDMGRVQLVWVGKRYSVGYILSAKDPIALNETLVSSNYNSDHPKGTRTLRRPIEIP